MNKPYECEVAVRTKSREPAALMDFSALPSMEPTYKRVLMIEKSAFVELRADAEQLACVLKFYENVTRLMLSVRDLPEVSEIEGLKPILKSLDLMDNGDKARLALKIFRSKYPMGGL